LLLQAGEVRKGPRTEVTQHGQVRDCVASGRGPIEHISEKADSLRFRLHIETAWKVLVLGLFEAVLSTVEMLMAGSIRGPLVAWRAHSC
jgi:hypothetical protein